MLKVYKQYRDGLITNGERYNKVIDIWAHVTERVSEVMFDELAEEDRKLEVVKSKAILIPFSLWLILVPVVVFSSFGS